MKIKIFPDSRQEEVQPSLCRREGAIDDALGEIHRSFEEGSKDSSGTFYFLRLSLDPLYFR